MDFHTRIAGDFHDSYTADANRLERMAVWRAALERHAPARTALAYDVGCGTGRLTGEIAARADRVIAVDGAEGMLAVARRHLSELGFPQTEFRQAMLPLGDLGDLPPAALVISSSVIEYVPDLPGSDGDAGGPDGAGRGADLLHVQPTLAEPEGGAVRPPADGKARILWPRAALRGPATVEVAGAGRGADPCRDALFRRGGPDESPVPHRPAAEALHQHDLGGRPAARPDAWRAG